MCSVGLALPFRCSSQPSLPVPACSCGAASDPTGCAELTEITVFYAIWFSVFTAVNIAVVRRSARMRRLLNPVSSGVVNI